MSITLFLRSLGRATGCCGLLLCLLAPPAAAVLTERDQLTLTLERMVADDPHAALLQAQRWEGDAVKAADRPLRLKALRLRAMALGQLEEANQLEEPSTQGLTLARELGDAEAEAEFIVSRGVKRSNEGKFREAQAEYDRAIAVAGKAGLGRAVAAVQLAKAYDFGLMGRNAEAVDLLYRTHQKFEEMGDVYGARATLLAIGVAYIHEKASPEQLRKAIDFLTRAITPGAEKSGRHELANIHFNLGAVHQRLGDFARAREHLQKSMSLFRDLNDPSGVAFGNFRLSAIAGKEKNWRESLDFANQALPVLTGTGDVVMLFNTHGARARALAELDRRRDSLEALQQADTTRRKSDSAALEVGYYDVAAQVYARLGEFDKAFRYQVQLREAERRGAEEVRTREEREARARFEAREKEAENEILRAREREAGARTLALALAVLMLLVVLGGLGWYLWRQDRQSRRFATLALSDDLTGLPNRRSILEFAGQQVERARGEKLNLCLALIDIDHFKAINDASGHAVGDVVLTAFARICSQQLRSDDRLGRYGGEEFMLIMPGSDIAQTPQVFARLRQAAGEIHIGGATDQRQLTFSMGVAHLQDAADDLERMTKRADDALYRAKQGGRDRYELG